MNKRIKEIDILKGILILFVVIGHYPFINQSIKQIIFWFHMPLFFIISGYFYKNRGIINYESLKSLIRKYIVPYGLYFLLISLIIERNIDIKLILKFIYTGRALPGVYWYLPCLVLTIIFFNIIINKFSKKNSIAIFMICGILASLESLVFNLTDKIIKLPLNIDVCLITLVYFSIGFYFKDKISLFISNKDRKFYIISAISMVCSLIFIILAVSNNINYIIDLKYSKYQNPVLNVLLPLLFGITLISLSSQIGKTCISNFLVYLGTNTLPIMFLHMPINNLLLEYFDYGIVVYTLIGLILPIIFSIFINRIEILKYIFTESKITNN